MINGLARRMLAKAGIESSYLMIHSAEEGYFDRDFISVESRIVEKLEDYKEPLTISLTLPDRQPAHRDARRGGIAVTLVER